MIIHSPVLLEEVCSFVPSGVKLIVDGTLGHGWHSLAFLQRFPGVHLIWLDVDEGILHKAKERLKEYEKQTELIHSSYSNLDNVLHGRKADYILLDLGVNLEHFLDTQRGFSFKGNATLDMRFDQTLDTSALKIIQTYKESDLSNLFIRYADFTQKKAQELAEAIVRSRKKEVLDTTFALKHVLSSCGLGQSAMAVIFQAIRIEVNQEIRNLETFLEKIPSFLAPGGRCAIMSYHSIEDRCVKQAFQSLVESWKFKLLTKKVIQPHYTEVAKNKAARSAKMRVIEWMM